MGDGRAELGLAGESAALEQYLARGFRLVARNWRCPAGEVDLIVERGAVLVFCEVKTRRAVGFGGGYEAVTSMKQRKLRQLAELFLRERRTHAGDIRFDVASVSVGARGRASVELFEDAF
jgi:putative endonuclease